MNLFEQIFNGIEQAWQSLKEWLGISNNAHNLNQLNNQRVMEQLPLNNEPHKTPKTFEVKQVTKKSFTVVSVSESSKGKMLISRPRKCPVCHSEGTIIKLRNKWHCKRNEEKDIGCGHEWE